MNRISSSQLKKSISGFLFAPAIVCAGASILENSPFLPPDFNAPSTAAPQRTTPTADERFLEFRGVYQLDKQLYFNIYDKRSNKGSWVNLNDSDSEFFVTGFDDDENSLTLNLDGKTATLELIATSDRSIPLASNTNTANQRGTRVATPSPTARTPSTNSPVRRRVIRPSGRSSNPTSTQRRIVTPSNP